MTTLVRRLVRSRALTILSIVLWVSGAAKAEAEPIQAQQALIMANAGGLYVAIVAHLRTYLEAAGYTVTDVTVLPGDLASPVAYAQVWDVRYNVVPSGGEDTTYANYLTGGGSLFLMGENTGAAPLRDAALIAFVAARGGGTLVQAANSAALRQTVNAPFTGPNTVTSVLWAGSGRFSNSAAGSFIATDVGGGSAVVFSPGTLTGAAAGTLIVVMDVNFLLDNPGTTEPDLLILLAKNLIAYLAEPTVIGAPVPDPTPSPDPSPAPAPSPSGPPPTITSIANQVVAIGSSTTVGFSVGGRVINYALTVRASASNPTFLPSLVLNRNDQISGGWTLTVSTADGRSGSGVITVTVTDGTLETSTSFTISSPLVPTGPANLVASSSGSGIVLTWSAPASGPPARYVISGNTTAGGSDLTTPGGANMWVFVTPDVSTSYVIPMVPPGTYYFRVQAVADLLGMPSNEASVAASGSTLVLGVPTGIISTVDGSNITLSWTPPAGPERSQYQVEFGTAPGRSDVAVVNTTASTLTRAVTGGLYFMRVRSSNGGASSAPSNDASIPVAPGACTTTPFVPVLLPVSRTGGVVSFSWLPPASWLPTGGTVPSQYRVDLTDGSGAVSSVLTSGAGTSATWAAPAGTYRARVTAGNVCGISAPSNEVAFAQP